MIRDAVFIAVKDVRLLLRAKETILWVFVMPVVFFFFIGNATGGFQRPGGARSKLAVRTGENPGFLYDEFAKRLDERKYDLIAAQGDSLFAAHARRLTIPAGFTDSLLAAQPVTVRFERSESGIGLDYDALRLKRAMYTVLADLIVAARQDSSPSAEDFGRLREMPRALRLEVTPAGKRKIVPAGFQQAIPGIMVMFTLLVMTTSGAILLVIERRQGLLRRLAYAPIHRLAIVLGKWGGKLALGAIQIAFGMLAGTVLFHMDWGPNLAMVIAVMVAYGGLMASVGLLLGSLARTEGQAAAIGVIASNVLAALGGCWWPIEIAPAWMQKLQLALPTGWAMDALHKLVSFETSPTAVLPHLLVMAVCATTILLLSARFFRFD
jgi:ABC-type multidrug transport system permease subunit